MSSRLWLLATVLIAASPAFAGYRDSAPQDTRVFPVGESVPPIFEPTALTETLKEGVDSKGAIYRYEVPHDWNGDLVMTRTVFAAALPIRRPARWSRSL